MKPTNENLSQRIRDAVAKEIGLTKNWTFEAVVQGLVDELDYHKGFYEILKKHKIIKDKNE